MPELVNVDLAKYNGPTLDLHEVIKYADERGSRGYSLYVNHIALERRADELFPLYYEVGSKRG